MSDLIPGHAARGFECSDTMIEGAKGFAVSFASRPNFEAGLDGLGKTFEITTLAYKPYPSGVVIHPIIDACLEIADARPLEAAQIERIELTVNSLAVKLTNLVEPKNRGQGLVSMQQWTAAALVHGTAGIAQVTDAVVRDPAMSQLRRKVTHAAVESMKPEAAEVRVVLKDGRILRAGR